MRSSTFKIWALALLAACAAKQAAAPGDKPTERRLEPDGGGGMTGGGGEDIDPAEHSAWFMGKDRTIGVCLDVAPDFGLSAREAAVEFRKAWKQWAEYVDLKKIHQEHEEYRPELSLKIKVATEGCRGQEDLRVLLGTSTSASEAVRARRKNPVAFVEQDRLNPSKDGGFLWVASANRFGEKDPDWKKPYALRGLLLHEMGHILGTWTHVPGTIMREDIKQLVRYQNDGSAEAKRKQAQLTHIDDAQELYLCEHCRADLPGTIPSEAAEFFESVVGQKTVSAERAIFHARSSALGALRFPVMGLEIEKKLYRLTLEGPDGAQIVESPFAVFKIAFTQVSGAVTSEVVMSQTARSILLKTVLELANGQKIPLTLERNVSHYGEDDALMRLFYLRYKRRDGKTVTAFLPDLPSMPFDQPLEP